MNWFYIKHQGHHGKFNMDFDVNLAKACKKDEAVFRLYQWKPFAISLGANQNFEDINVSLSEADGVEVVKRPTGGRAILHANEITYSAVIPTKSGFSSKEIYNKISKALLKGLVKFDRRLVNLQLEMIQPDFKNLLKSDTGMICFASTARHEVKFNGKKLIGSAQRKMNNVILQHGSILVDDFHLKLIKYLNVLEEEKSKLLNEMINRTTNLKDILNTEIDYPSLYNCLLKGMEEEWESDFEEVLRMNA